MISKEQKKIIIESIGSKHITKLSEYCEANRITKDDGEFYSKSMLSMVLNGAKSQVSHEKLENAIFSAAEYYLDKREKEAKSREKFLEKAQSRVKPKIQKKA